jgi:Zn-dependent peptidase ImmA (M78 family)
VLVWARETAGFSLQAVALKFGAKFKVQRLESWESGDDRPTINQLRTLSEIYKRPLAVFYLPGPPRDFPVPHDFRRLPDVGPPAYSPRLRVELRLAQERRQVALSLYEELDEAPPDFPLRATRRDTIEAVASRARIALGIPIEQQVRWNDAYVALRNWRRAIEALGVLVFQVSDIDPTEMRGFSFAEDVLPVIAVNRSGRESPRARTFSFMHELTHLMLRESSICDFDERLPRSQADQLVEIFCNRVAAEILVPKAHLLAQQEVAAHPDRPREWQEHDIAALAKRYSVSREVIVRSLLTHGRTTEAYYQKKREEYRRQYREWKDEQTGGFEKPGDKRLRLLGSSFTRLVLETYYNGRMTLSEAVGHLGIKVGYLQQLEQSLGAV